MSNVIESRFELSNARFAEVALSPSVLSSLVPIAVTSDDGAGAPAADSRQGNVFVDGGDEQVHWYLPEWVLAPAPDASFGLAAVRGLPLADGTPYNSATVTFGIVKQVPDDVRAAIAASPGAAYDEIPLAGLAATLRLTVKDDAGNDVVRALPGTVAVDPEGASAKVAVPLSGPDVVVAFEELTAGQGASLEITGGYTVVRWATDTPAGPRLPPWLPGRIDRVRRFPEMRVAVPVEPEHPLTDPDPEVATVQQVDVTQQLDVAQLQVARPLGLTSAFRTRLDPRTVSQLEVTRVEPLRLPDPEPDPAPEPARVAVRETAGFVGELPLGTAYSSPSYRPGFTLAVDGKVTGIRSVDDLVSFNASQTEYVEVTALGPIAQRFPSFRALYLGLFSGTAIAVPAAYGIARRPDGLAARCDAIVDPSASSGCRFQLTFGLAPVVDPGELALLEAALAAEPSLGPKVEQVILPTDLDPRTPGTLSSASIAKATFAVGDDPGELVLVADIVDDDVPAVEKVDLVLSQLADVSTTSLVGSLAVRLDEGHEGPVTSAVKLSLDVTAGDGDISLVVAQDGGVRLANLSPHPLTITSLTVRTAGQIVASAPGAALAVGGAWDVPAAAGADLVVAACRLDLGPGPVTAHGYVDVHAETTTVVHHVLGFNAAGQLAPDLAAVRIQASVAGLPDLQLPAVTLTPDHQVDSITADLPVLFAVSGMAADLAVTVTPAQGAPYDVHLVHDFTAHPTLNLVRSDLAPPQP
ncbi:hypothetical protein [Nocardioides ultimimeridianus]